MPFHEYVKNFRIDYHLTLRGLGEGLTQYAPPDEPCQFQKAWNWERGENVPRLSWLHWVATKAPAGSWQQMFALNAMQLIRLNLPVGQGNQ